MNGDLINYTLAAKVSLFEQREANAKRRLRVASLILLWLDSVLFSNRTFIEMITGTIK
jgi:hypothetical protein